MRFNIAAIACAGTLCRVATPSAQTAPPAPPDPLVLEIGLHLFQGEQQAPSIAANSAHGARAGALVFSGYIWSNTTLCLYVSSDKPPAATTVGTPSRGSSTDVPSIAWFVSGKLLDRTGDDFHVRFDWQRLWYRSKRQPDAPKESRVVTIRRGDRIELDDVVPEAASPCRMTAARLEAAIVPESDARRAGGFDRGMSPDEQVQIHFLTRSGANGSGSAFNSSGDFTPVPDSMMATADLWLVHTAPGGKEDAQSRSVRLPISAGADGTDYVFSPVAIETRNGSVAVGVSGVLRFVNDSANQLSVSVQIVRDVTGAVKQTGSTTKIIGLPAAKDVVSIEMPAVAASPADLLAGHEFALRLKIGGGR